MRAGRLRQRVTVQQKTVTRNDYGEEIVTWADVLTAWAAVEPLRGREFDEAQMAGAERLTRIVLRWPGSGVTLRPEMRVYHAGRVYDIQSVIHVDERHREVQLHCKELV